MRAILLLIAGIVLLSNSGWFAGAHLIGLILTVIGGLGTLIILLVYFGAFAVVGAAIKDGTKPRRR